MGGIRVPNGVIEVTKEGKTWMEILFNKVLSHIMWLLLPFSYPPVAHHYSGHCFYPCLNSCKNGGMSLKLNTYLSTILNLFCACSAQNNETPRLRRVGREQRHSANRCLVIIFPLVPVSLPLPGGVQNHVSHTTSSLALCHLLKGGHRSRHLV